MRPLLIEASWGRMLVDCGAGDKMGEKAREIYALDRTRHLDHALDSVGLTADDIDLVLPTHLHFDHFGGATRRRAGRGPALRARALHHPGRRVARRHASARAQPGQLPAGRLRAARRGRRRGPLRRRPDHPAGRARGADRRAHRPAPDRLRGGRGKTIVFVADLIPTTAHLQDPWVMGYDLFPMETMAFKQRFIREAIDREYLIVFEHDPLVAAGYIRERDGRRTVEPVL